ncbi:hypothetical protein [Streptomyces sp. NPDC002057]|uniref:hypothetical protein n=1 Tax=Streptomyces sp. NPDC002057 TaxID=3154664 RepID=UPI00332559D3
MRSASVGAGAVLAVAALLTSCSSGDGGGDTAPKGAAAAEVCEGFAGDAPAAAALRAVMGAERFTDDLSEPEEALDGLRDATRVPRADTYRPRPLTYCRLLPAEGGTTDLAVELGTAAKAPGLRPEHAGTVTSYTSGLQAFSSSGIGRLYFSCRLPAPAHGIVVETVVRGPAGVPDGDLEQRTRLITLANAAARQVSAELGCAGDGLAPGVPAGTTG